MKILGIETSCDDTGVAVYDDTQGLICHSLYSQISTHQEYGGVVPELAARDHIRKILPLLDTMLSQAKLHRRDIDALAYTAGPGLAGALLAGSAIAKGLAFSLGIPSIGVHHMEAHMLAPMLEKNPPSFPFIALLVSGGHTLLAQVQGIGKYHILGQTLDDAAGEAFDKTAKLLGLSYPGGPSIARAANDGNSLRFRFPRPMLDRPGMDFSFSGLKTFAMTMIEKELHQKPLTKSIHQQTIADISAGFQLAVVDTLVKKTTRALEHTKSTALVIAGGVGANQALRKQLDDYAKKTGLALHYPRPEFCTDNGAMIALVGHLRKQQMRHDMSFSIKPRWPLDSLPTPDEIYP